MLSNDAALTMWVASVVAVLDVRVNRKVGWNRLARRHVCLGRVEEFSRNR